MGLHVATDVVWKRSSYSSEHGNARPCELDIPCSHPVPGEHRVLRCVSPDSGDPKILRLSRSPCQQFRGQVLIFA